MECSNPECKGEFKAALQEIGHNLYGAGPEGKGGVYGDLKKKVSWKAMVLLISPVLGVVGYFITFALTHEARMTKAEVVIQNNAGIIA